MGKDDRDSGAALPGQTLLDSALPRDVLPSDPGSRALRARLANKLFAESRSAPKLGRFEILRMLGKGGLGVVYSARDPELDRIVALKVLHAPGLQSLQRRQLRREAQALARLNHPNVVAVYEVGETEDADPTVFIAMEYVEGETLQDRQDRTDDNDLSDIVEAYRQAGRGLAVAHTRGIVHRDFKPANVLIGTDGRVRVADFGLARGASADMHATPPSKQHRGDQAPTLTGFAGTPQFMAPEQFREEPADTRADQFSFCVAFYQALFGVFPYTVEQLRRAEQEPPPVREAARRGRPELKKTLLRGLELDPDDRFQNIESLLSELDLVPQKKRRRVFMMWGGAAALVSAGALAMSEPEASLCAEPAETIDKTWNEDRRSSVESAFANRDEPFARDVGASLIEGFDRYADDWMDDRRAACSRSSGDAATATGPEDLALSCLDRARANFHASIDFVSRPALEQALVVSSEEILRGLDDPRDCLSPRSGRRAEAVGPSKQGRLDRRLHTAQLLYVSARYNSSAEEAEATVRESRESGSGETEALALLLLARLERAAYRVEAAESRLFAALALAQAQELPEVGAAAWLELTMVAASDRESEKEAKRWLAMAAAAVERAGKTSERRAELEQARGEVLLLGGQLSSAGAAFDLAVVILESDPSAQPDRLASALVRRANVYSADGRPSLASPLYDRALEIRRSRVGAEHPAVAAIEFDLGLDAIESGELRRAEALLEHVLEVESATLGGRSLRHAKTALALSMVAMAEGRVHEALPRAIVADEVLRSVLPVGHTERLSGLLMRATLELASGDYEASLASHSEALEEYERGSPTDAFPLRNNLGWLAEVTGNRSLAEEHSNAALELLPPGDPRRAYPLVTLGAVALDKGRLAVSVELLEEALLVGEPIRADDPALLPETRWRLAVALASLGGDAKRTQQLAEAALNDVAEISQSELATRQLTTVLGRARQSP